MDAFKVSNYIMDLRKIVGHRPLLQVDASVIVIDSGNRLNCRTIRTFWCVFWK